MGVNAENKHLIAQRGAISKLLRLLKENNSSAGMNSYSSTSAHGGPLSVKVEVVAALANLAVNGDEIIYIYHLYVQILSLYLVICAKCF
jgi:hypothetical protein